MKLAFPLAVVVVFALAALGLADGFVRNRGGYVREERQAAFIDWRDGQETLCIATTTVPTKEPTLWIVPVPAPPHQVTAEPVEQFPYVLDSYDVVEKGKGVLNKALFSVWLLDSGIFCWAVCALPGCARQDRTADDPGVSVYQRQETLGVVVETLTAKSAAALDQYLAAKALGAKASDLDSLAPYTNGEHTLVCSWRADASDAGKARAIRITFPSPKVFYPLQPSRVYGDKIDTTVIVRGWFQPSNGQAFRNLRCRYLRGTVAFGEGKAPGGQEPLTLVKLAEAPPLWREDLVMEPGEPEVVRQALFWVDGHGFGWTIIGVGAMGFALGPCLLLVAAPGEQRRRRHYLIAGLVGATVVFSVWVPLLVYWAWCRERASLTTFRSLKQRSAWWREKWIVFGLGVLIHCYWASMVIGIIGESIFPAGGR
jgi:hypothetical protein